MKNERKDQIYDRLLEINFSIETEPILEPRYLNEKFGELHSYIEEVGQFAIQVNKELSVYQRNLNNAQAIYDAEKERLLTEDDDIVNLPNIRDREAKANSKLKSELQEIRDLQDEVTDLNNLSKSISLKLRNLSRANSDIRMQVRIMESQIKLGTFKDDPVRTRDIQQEMRSSIEGTDSFEHAETTAGKNQAVDPSQNIVDDLFEAAPDDEAQEVEDEHDQEDDQYQEEQHEQESEDVPESVIEPFAEPGIDPEEDTPDFSEPSEDIVEEAEKEISSESPIDLDSIIDTEISEEPETSSEPEPEPESVPEQDAEPETGGDTETAQEEDSQKGHQETDAGKTKTDKIDIDDLLAQYS